jgi:hypothetical protein
MSMTDRQQGEPNKLTPEEAREVIKAIEEVERQEADAQARQTDASG